MFEFNEKDIMNATKAYFINESPLKLRQFPSKQKKKYIVLNIIIKAIPDKVFTEKEISDFLKNIYPDFVTIRRALIDYKLMSRTKDGSKYWINKEDM